MVACFTCCNLWRSCLLFVTICIWIAYQFGIINRHDAIVLDTNPYEFAERFNFIRISRTNLHSKTFQYWVDWFKHRTVQQVGDTTFTLLHFDYHSNYDITHDQIHPCSASQLIYYHQLVEEVLESLDEILHPINTNKNGITNITNITQYVYQYGYINTIVWLYPNHWINYTESFVYGLNYHRFRALISNITYYVTPIGDNKYKYTFNAHGLKQDEIELIQTKLSFSKTITPHINMYNSATSIEFRIHAIALSELQTLVLDDSEIFTKNKVIMSFDLDFFLCQSPAETLKDYFNWNNNEISDILNTYLSHHQYAPSHISTEDLHYAMLVLLHQLAHNQSDTKAHLTGLRSDDDFVDDLDESAIYDKDKMKEDLPNITDVMQHASEYHLQPMEVRDLLYHLYRFHLEIGDMQFVQPMNHYIQTHHHLDTYLYEITNDTSHVVDHHALHKQIAQKLKVNIDDSDAGFNVSVNQFAEINDMNDYPYFDDINKWIKNDQLVHSEMKDVNETDEEEFITQLLQKLMTDGSIYRLTPLLLSEIIHNITQQHNYNVTYWIDIISNANALQNVSIWDPKHVEFIHLLQKQYDISPTEETERTYTESLETLQLSGDYLYTGWQKILNHHSMNTNASWINKYVDEENKTFNHEWNDTNDKLSTHNLSDIIAWHSLDPIQQHFIRKANHSLIEKWMDSLTKHQKKFLDWLIFCHLHGHICESGHSPIDLLESSNADYMRLQNVDWEDMNELPAIVASDEHNDMLQFITAVHGMKHGKKHKEHERKYIPDLNTIRNDIDSIVNILIDSKISPMTIGIEMSYGHIPKHMHEWLDCQLSISLYNALQTQSQFVTFYASEGDQKKLHYDCIKDLVGLLDEL